MENCQEVIRQIRQKVDQYSQSLAGCRSAMGMEIHTRNFVTCIVSLGVKDHYADIVSVAMPQDFGKQKDPAENSEAFIVSLLRQLKKNAL